MVNYDNTVRDSDNSVIQYQVGSGSLCPKYVQRFADPDQAVFLNADSDPGAKLDPENCDVI